MDKKFDLTTAIYVEIQSRIKAIFDLEDSIQTKEISLTLIKYLSATPSLLQFLSYCPLYSKFLKLSFEMFFSEPKNLDLCVSLFLLSDYEALNQDGSFKNVLERIYEIPKYSVLKNRVKKSKSVVFDLTKNERKTFIKAGVKNARTSPSNSYDIGEYNNVKKETAVDWAPPKKYSSFKLKITKEMQVQKIRESSTNPHVNLNISAPFYPVEMYENLEDNLTRGLPILNYCITSEVPSEGNLSNLTEYNFVLPSVEDILEDPSILLN